MGTRISSEAVDRREQDRRADGRFGAGPAAESDVTDLTPAAGEGLQELVDRLVRDVDLDQAAVSVTEDGRIVVAPPGSTPGASHVQIEVTEEHLGGGRSGWTATTLAVGPPDHLGARADDRVELVVTTEPAELARALGREIDALDDDGYGGTGSFPVRARPAKAPGRQRPLPSEGARSSRPDRGRTDRFRPTWPSRPPG